MNPIIFFDELDKISETKSGDEIIGLLIHLIDNSQNNSFNDKYFSGIDLDLSKCFFIFSFNDESKINPILRDRIKIIKLKGFKNKEKIQIAKHFSLPKICKNTGFNIDDVVFEDKALDVMISNYCPEEGVRQLEKCLETIIMKLNLFNVTQNWKTLNREENLNLTKPYKITEDLIEKLLHNTFEKKFENLSRLLIYS
jgi:ATP-dependent Lon protease